MLWARLELPGGGASAWRTCTPRRAARAPAAAEVVRAAERGGRLVGRRPARVRRRPQPAPARATRAVRGAARALRPGAAHRARTRSTTCWRAASRWSSARGGWPRSDARSRGRRAAHPPLRPRSRRRGVRREIVRRPGGPTEGGVMAEKRSSRHRSAARAVATTAKPRRQVVAPAALRLAQGRRPQVGPRRPAGRPQTATTRKAAAKKGGQAAAASRRPARPPARLPRRPPPSRQRGRGGQERRRVPRGPAQEPDPSARPRDAHPRAHRGGARRRRRPGALTADDAQRIATRPGRARPQADQRRAQGPRAADRSRPRRDRGRAPQARATHRAVKARRPALAQADKVRRGAGRRAAASRSPATTT